VIKAKVTQQLKSNNDQLFVKEHQKILPLKEFGPARSSNNFRIFHSKELYYSCSSPDNIAMKSTGCSMWHL
jgi:hypothetical protein